MQPSASCCGMSLPPPVGKVASWWRWPGCYLFCNRQCLLEGAMDLQGDLLVSLAEVNRTASWELWQRFCSHALLCYSRRGRPQTTMTNSSVAVYMAGARQAEARKRLWPFTRCNAQPARHCTRAGGGPAWDCSASLMLWQRRSWPAVGCAGPPRACRWACSRRCCRCCGLLLRWRMPGRCSSAGRCLWQPRSPVPRELRAPRA